MVEKARKLLVINAEVLYQIKRAGTEQNRSCTNMIETILVEWLKARGVDVSPSAAL